MSLKERLIAVVEDDPIMGESLAERLSLEGAKVAWWQTCRSAVEGLRNLSPDAVVCDLRLPDGGGEDVLKAAAERADAPPFLFVTAFGDIDQAVRLMKSGAGDYLTKPFETGVFIDRLRQLLRPRPDETGAVLGVSPEMRALQTLLARIAGIPAPVLLTGETGVGKEVCARLLHQLRGPDAGPFMAINCAAIPKDLLESELFGHERGAFTGAGGRHLGYAERAGRGTLFLDEVGELETRLQAKLLRLLEDRSFHRLGGEAPVVFRARLVCATNADLPERVRLGQFREDLLYRINTLAIEVPPLRSRPLDIEWLADRFFADCAASQGSALSGLSTLAVEALVAHQWPGNARELRNRMERAVALSLGPCILPGDLFPERGSPAAAGGGIAPLEAARDEAEKRQIMRALRQSKGGITAAATLLGISRTTMWEKMRRHRIEASEDS